MRRILIFLPCLLAGACGPLPIPMFTRLDAPAQTQVNQIWNNMLTPPDRLDREVLLDVILAFELHAYGVDRGTFHSEKDLAEGKVMMDVQYDRLKPLEDRFDVTIYDGGGAVVRTEHYSGEEITSQWRSMGMAPTTERSADGIAGAARRPVMDLDEQKLAELSREIRWARILAATRPATEPAG